MVGATPHNEASQLDEVDVRLCLDGDDAAFRRLFDRHYRRVYGIVHRVMRNDHDAQDVTQEVFIKTYRSLASFEGRSSFYTWIRQIAINKAIDCARSRRHKTLSLNEETTEARSGALSPEDVARDRELKGALDEALSEISRPHREVFTLYTFRGLAYREIAEKLDISIGTVMSRLFYARKKLQEKLGSYLAPVSDTGVAL